MRSRARGGRPAPGSRGSPFAKNLGLCGRRDQTHPGHGGASFGTFLHASPVEPWQAPEWSERSADRRQRTRVGQPLSAAERRPVGSTRMARASPLAGADHPVGGGDITQRTVTKTEDLDSQHLVGNAVANSTRSSGTYPALTQKCTLSRVTKLVRCPTTPHHSGGRTHMCLICPGRVYEQEVRG